MIAKLVVKSKLLMLAIELFKLEESMATILLITILPVKANNDKWLVRNCVYVIYVQVHQNHSHNS